MKSQFSFNRCLQLLSVLALTLPGSAAFAQDQPLLISAARVFDGYTLRTDAAVLISEGKVARIDGREAFNDSGAPRLDLGDATLLPGFIELHAHLSYQHVPADTVLRHGVTTVRDVGGPLHQPYGGDGSLRLMTSGPILTAPAGYPIPNLGETDIAMPVADAQQARQAVRKLVAGGAVVIKVALEPGGEAGAPWSGGHAHAQHAHSKMHDKPHSWPMLSPVVLAAIVDEAHQLGRRVAAHLAESKGAQLALDVGIDEWAHTPCETLPDAQLHRAVAQQVRIVSTIDTLSKCSGVSSNVRRLAELGAEFLYGAEIAHPDIPWGIDGQELLYLQHLAGMTPLDVIRIATSNAGQYLNIPLLGTLLPGAPADMIAVKGDPMQKLKLLEYPDLVMSGGKLIINYFGS
ncbi:amidohydrolase family protein [Methylomonas methanica]|uniref:Amidohydrolase n=1 Tax=Methylomonas methanica TaxID=421 RepID=A0A177MGY3_METMH|nr:amidohydrolase family protein [Methylomonas methanica]OAI04200.1 amidohydrolase [Methylomonas methanica]